MSEGERRFRTSTIQGLSVPSTSELVPRVDALGAQIRIGARLGIWGFVGGFGTMTAFTLGAPLSLGVALAAMGGGVLLSGIGIVAASLGVLRKPGSVPRIIRTAALAGVPLGGLLAALGLTSLTQWAPLVAIVNALVPAAGAFGVAVIILLVVGFFVAFPDEADAEVD